MTAGRRRRAAASLVALTLGVSGCGGGGEVVVGTGPVVPGPVFAGLDLVLTRVGVAVIQLDWSYDPIVAVYQVVRDGYPLAQVATTTLVDASLVPGYRYCYQVSGIDANGREVSRSDVGCLSVI